jgi:transposase InsO family protein
LHLEATRATAKAFPEYLITAVPYAIHTILPDNGIQFTNRKKEIMAFMTPFDRVCRTHGIEHRVTKMKHPWTNGQVERMNRTINSQPISLHKPRRIEETFVCVPYGLYSRFSA